MDRRQFFRFGLSGLRDAAKKSAPDIVKPAFATTTLDLSILTSQQTRAEELVDEYVREHFGERMLRLKTSVLSGSYPGGVVLFENNFLRSHHDGVSLFYAAVKQLEHDLGLPSMQKDPTLLRFVNTTPPFSRSVEIFQRDRLLLALPLAEDGTFEFEGLLGRMEFRVEHGAFSVTAALCPHGTCMAHPPIRTPGQRITCVPNQVSAIVGAYLGK